MPQYEDLLHTVLQKLAAEGIEESSFNRTRALHAIRDSYIFFLQRSHILRRRFVIDSQAGVNEYPLFKHDGEVIAKIFSITFDHCCYAKAKSCACNCCPCTYAYHAGVLTLCPAPKCDHEPIEICASVFPDADACEMDEFVFEHYRYQIASGAAHLLLSKKNSAPYQVEYDAGITAASIQAAEMHSVERTNSKRTKWVRR